MCAIPKRNPINVQGVITMRLPYLDIWDNAKCIVFISGEKPSENGDFPSIKAYEGGCNFSEKANTIRTTDGQYVKLNGVIHIKGDIAPKLATFNGKVKVTCDNIVKDREMQIASVDRPRNPDGTVHHTRLGLI